eukprot:4574721-Amphidinium_carterae.1
MGAGRTVNAAGLTSLLRKQYLLCTYDTVLAHPMSQRLCPPIFAKVGVSSLWNSEPMPPLAAFLFDLK